MKNIKKGFTLVELLFVMAIIAILAGFAIANLKDSTKVATENSLKNDVKNIIAQQHTYFAANQHYFTCSMSFDTTGKAQCTDSESNEDIPNLYIFASKPYNNKWAIINPYYSCDDNSIGFAIKLNDETLGKNVTYNSCTDAAPQLNEGTGC